MLFRLGGLFIVYLLSANALRTIWPFSLLTFEAGAVATLTAYAVMAFFVARSYLRGRALNTKAITTSFPLWPTKGSSHPGVFITFIFLEASLILVAYLTNADKNSIIINAMLPVFGVFALVFVAYAIKFGYFPSIPGKSIGVSRNDDPTQFWVTAIVFIAIGLLIFSLGIREIWVLIK